MPMEWGVNYGSVLAAAIAAMVVGFVWYLPAIAGNAWSKATGKTAEEMRAAMTPVVLIEGFVIALFKATVLAAVIGWAAIDTLGGGIVMGVVIWLGLIFATQAETVLYEGRPSGLYWVLGGNSLVTFVVMGGLIAWWPWGGAV